MIYSFDILIRKTSTSILIPEKYYLINAGYEKYKMSEKKSGGTFLKCRKWNSTLQRECVNKQFTLKEGGSVKKKKKKKNGSA